MNQIQIENKSGKVKLTDAVTPFSVEKLTEDIGKLFGASASEKGADFGVIMNCAENAVDTLEIEINSPGGSIFDGYNVYNEILSLRERGVFVTATVTGMAASMASVICMACDEVRIVPHGRMMIHEASQAVRGNSDELRKAADLLDGISADIAQKYSEKTGKPLEDIRALMKAETWLNAKQAVEMGLADAVFDIRAAKPKPTGMNLLSKLFPNNDEAAKIEAAIVENDSLRADLEAAQARVSELTALADENVSLKAELNEVNAKLAESDRIANESAEKIAELETKVTDVENIAAAKAVETLAAIGQPEPLAIEEASETKSILDEYNELKGAAATAFFNKHEKEIIAAQRKLK